MEDKRILIGDIETIKSCLDFGFYNHLEDKWYEFEISKYQNDLYSFINFYSRNNWDYIVWYNGIDFDTQVIQFIIDKHIHWGNLTGLEICAIVYEFTQRLIENKSYGMFNPYQQYKLEIKPIDVYTILGLDNEARRSSLKKCEFQLDYPNVEEMPIHHSREDLTEDEIQQIKSYRRNDVLATYELYKLVLGLTDHPLYKGNNQIDLRLDIQEEFGIDCLNYSDIKIGDELLKHSYAKAIGKEVKELPKKGFFRKEIKLKHCIPKYVEFKTPQLQKLLKETKLKVIKQTDKHESEFIFKKTKYTIGLGGGHSDNTSEIWESDENYQLVDLDVGSLYPAIIVNNSYYPYHLGKELLNVYKQLYLKRIELKPLSKKDKKIAGIVGAIKLILNSAYGKMGSMDSWMYDKQVQVSVCLTGQFALLMLIEDMELAEIPVFSFNTDGITLKLHKDKKEEFEQICKDWEEKTAFVLEIVDYKKIIYSTVNDYLAITTDGKVKTKGDFISDFELWKNKSNRVIGLALQAYFTKGIKPEDFINNHKNIYDYCIMARATGQMHLELQNKNTYGNYEVTQEMLIEDGWTTNEFGWIFNTDSIWSIEDEIERTYSFHKAVELYKKQHPINTVKLKKLVRYYLSSDSEWQLYKRGTGTTGKKANISTNAENDLGEIFITYFNQFEEKPFEDYKVDLNQYIYKTYRIIAKVEKNKKDVQFIESLKQTNQLTLF